MPTYYPITGVPGGTSIRPELSSWSISKEDEHQIQVSLFIRALDILQKKDPLTDQLSFYRLAGIHSLPAQSWDNDDKPDETRGYCTHNSYLFPTWHRPYMALYEQCLYNIMIGDLVSKIENKSAQATWREAAKKWRLPFWDWALPQVDTGKFGVPNIVAHREVKIRKLGGENKDMDSMTNPLNKFKNRLKIKGSLEEVPMGDSRMKEYAIHPDEETKFFEKSIGTSRYGDPDGDLWPEGEVKDNLVANALENHSWGRGESKGSIADNVYRLLSEDYFRSYGPFSSTQYYHEHSATEHLSLEMIHNNIHNWTGGEQGHMANVPVAAFDPIFWMHHCNVDRLLAIWQFLNPNKWFDGISPSDTKPTDPLLPFHKDEHGTHHNSKDVETWEKLGYSYPELVPGMTIKKLREIINEKYNILKDMSISVPGVEQHKFPDYIINVQYDRYALGGNPYTINFTLADASGGNPRPVGQIYTFSAPLDLSCARCQSQKNDGVLSKAQVPITLDLHELFTDGTSFLDGAPGPEAPDVSMGMTPDYMGVFLGQLLSWSITTPHGETIPVESQPKLLVTVYYGRATFPNYQALDAFDPDAYRPLYRATHGKARGAQDPSL